MATNMGFGKQSGFEKSPAPTTSTSQQSRSNRKIHGDSVSSSWQEENQRRCQRCVCAIRSRKPSLITFCNYGRLRQIFVREADWFGRKHDWTRHLLEAPDSRFQDLSSAMGTARSDTGRVADSLFICNNTLWLEDGQ